VGENLGAAASTRRRIELLAPLPMTPEASFERYDAYQMTADGALSVGDLDTARTYARRIAGLAAYGESSHLGLVRLLMVNALAGEWDDVASDSALWLAAWESAGRPVVSNLAGAARAASLVYGIRGDEAQRSRWTQVGRDLRSAIDQLGGAQAAVGPLVDALVHLHRGAYDEAVGVLVERPTGSRTGSPACGGTGTPSPGPRPPPSPVAATPPIVWPLPGCWWPATGRRPRCSTGWRP
jgi:hypothetical protein